MGKLIRSLGEEKGHEVLLVIDDADASLSAVELAERLKARKWRSTSPWLMP